MQKLRAAAIAMLMSPAISQAQWTYVNSGTTAELRGLSAVNDRVVWASGARGTVVRTVDGGRTWQADSASDFGTLDLRSVHAMSEGRALAASAGEAEKGLARILATIDGRAWRGVYDTRLKGAFFDAIAFWDARRGVVLSDPVDGAFLVLRTDDGGRGWTRLPAASLPPVLAGEAAFAASGSSIALTGDANVWIGTGGGGRSRVMRSRDAGLSWSVADVPVHAEGPAAGIFSIAFFDARRGVAAGGDYTKPRLAASSVALTSDGGATWRAAKAPPAAYLSGVAFAGDTSRLVAVGLAGTFVSRDGGDSWTQTDTVAMNSVRCAGKRCFAAGPRGRVAYLDSIAP
ncbi:MAG TPA: hypothetical protein VFO66_08760 [Gemmatimonadaceae bacterium]|nr:hypothetical protein [Gemmatimonadaceae bacterium]